MLCNAKLHVANTSADADSAVYVNVLDELHMLSYLNADIHI